MRDLRDKKVLVIGLGKSGVAAARFCAEAGARVIAADKKEEGQLADALGSLRGLNIEFVLGRNDASAALASDLVVISPGVPRELPGLAEAEAKGIPVVGEMELAVQMIDRPIIAVTGTNGKTTTTALIGHLLSGAGVDVCVAGNIGTPLLDVVSQARKAQYIALEVSSFQIDTSPSLAPHIAVWLNVTQDHLDRHGTFENYVASKARLFDAVSAQGYGIYNAADDLVAQAVISSRCRLIPFDATGKIISQRTGAASGKYGKAWFGDGDLWISTDGVSSNRYRLSNVQLFGLHNRENMLAALTACELAGASSDELIAGLETFKGLPHRVEFVREVKGVRFYDDSKGTNVGATIRALEGFAEPVVLIAGGLSKGADFSPLAGILKEHVKKLVLIGEAKDEMARILGPSVSHVKAGSMGEAVSIATAAAEPGDVVLLSPACASFDMFKDYADRGRAFAEAVMGLPEGGKGKGN